MLLRGSVRRRHVYGASWIAMLGVAVFARVRRPPFRSGSGREFRRSRRLRGATPVARCSRTTWGHSRIVVPLRFELVGGVIYRNDAVAAQALVDVVTADDDEARCSSDATRLQ
jgi:hypothetical protein